MLSIRRKLAKLKIKLTSFLEDHSLIVGYVDEDSLTARHIYKWSAVFMGLVYYVFLQICKIVAAILVLFAVCGFIWFFGADMIYFLRYGELELTSIGQLINGPNFNVEYMVASTDWQGVGKILGIILSIPAFIAIPFLFWLLAHVIQPDEY